MHTLNLGFGKPEFEKGNPVVQAMRREHKQQSRKAHLRHGRDNQPHIESFSETVFKDLAAVGKAIGHAAGRTIEVITSHLEQRGQAAQHAGSLALEQSEVRRETL